MFLGVSYHVIPTVITTGYELNVLTVIRYNHSFSRTTLYICMSALPFG